MNTLRDFEVLLQSFNSKTFYYNEKKVLEETKEYYYGIARYLIGNLKLEEESYNKCNNSGCL